jgi:hypothetical protein
MPNPPSKAVDYRYKDNLKRRYNLEVEDYLTMVNNQQGACAICRQHAERLHVDHCHDTGQIRGLLCQNCNTALGKFHDNIEHLANAISYLAQHAGSIWNAGQKSDQ